jgi:hypothetical protein
VPEPFHLKFEFLGPSTAPHLGGGGTERSACGKFLFRRHVSGITDAGADVGEVGQMVQDALLSCINVKDLGTEICERMEGRRGKNGTNFRTALDKSKRRHASSPYRISSGNNGGKGDCRKRREALSPLHSPILALRGVHLTSFLPPRFHVASARAAKWVRVCSLRRELLLSSHMLDSS